MRRITTVVTISVMSLALSACANPFFEKRPDYAGADNIGAIDESLLVGEWKVEYLNPLSQEKQVSDTTFEFVAGGTVTSTSIVVPNSDDVAPLSYDLTRSWVVEGDLINQTITSVEETTGSPLVVFGVQLNYGWVTGRSTKFDVYEASADRLVLVDVNTGMAQAYSRIN